MNTEDATQQRSQDEHLVKMVSRSEGSTYVTCSCREKFYGATERDAREMHRAHRGDK